MDLITLSIPVYNVEQYVEQALLSALNQTYENIEYIIVDDKGTDKSMDIVRRVVAEHPRGTNVRIIAHGKNIGLGATRNTGIENATGDFIFFMDSDDEITPDCIEKLHSKMVQEDVDFVVGSVRRLLRTGEYIRDSISNLTSIFGYLETAKKFFVEREREALRVTTWNKLYKIKFLRDNNIYCYPNHLNEDNIFSFQVYLKAISCAFISDITYLYYDTPNSIVNVINRNFSIYFGLQYIEIFSFYRDYAKHYRNTFIYDYLLIFIINNILYIISLVERSIIMTHQEKKSIVSSIVIFPVSFKEIQYLSKRKLWFYLMWIIFKMPCKLLLFRIITRLSAIRKKWT